MRSRSAGSAYSPRGRPNSSYRRVRATKFEKRLRRYNVSQRASFFPGFMTSQRETPRGIHAASQNKKQIRKFDNWPPPYYSGVPGYFNISVRKDIRCIIVVTFHACTIRVPHTPHHTPRIFATHIRPFEGLAVIPAKGDSAGLKQHVPCTPHHYDPLGPPFVAI